MPEAAESPRPFTALKTKYIFQNNCVIMIAGTPNSAGDTGASFSTELLMREKRGYNIVETPSKKTEEQVKNRDISPMEETYGFLRVKKEKNEGCYCTI